MDLIVSHLNDFFMKFATIVYANIHHPLIWRLTKRQSVFTYYIFWNVLLYQTYGCV